MALRLPPLSALRAFEAVARHLSFTRAADELHVTPAAISQQVKGLEDQLGVQLFERSRRAVALTDAGVSILPDVRAGFASLSRVLDRNIRKPQGPALRISVAPSFASKWLLPRMPNFAAQYPDIQLRISATPALADLKNDEADLAIRFGVGRYPGLRSEPLFREALCPLCSPRFSKGKRALRTPADLKRFQLLHDLSLPGDPQPPGWTQWLNLAGVPEVNANRGTCFSLAELALQAAIDGAGVVLGRLALAEVDLAAGRLWRPFQPTLELDLGYFLVTPKRRHESNEVQCFRNWLHDVARSPSGKNSRDRKPR
jgi:LysR family glycine cleavage system transcriptional activator